MAAYPVTVLVAPAITNRNRLTTAFRAILAIPHVILAGGFGWGLAYQRDSRSTVGGEGGLLGAVAVFLAVVSWFTLVFTGRQIGGIRQFTAFYLRWRVRSIAYLMLLADPYPPFGDAPYPTELEIADEAGPRRRLSIFFRIFLALPHLIALVFVLMAWCVTTIIMWFAILFTGACPAGLHEFGTGVLRWRLRVEAYLLLMVDEYPPFSLT